jgi:hypothetical protein
MREKSGGASKGQAGSTRLLSTEELFEGFNEIYESAESEGESAGPDPALGSCHSVSIAAPIAQPAHLEITESGDAIEVRAEFPSLDFLEPPAAETKTEITPLASKRSSRRTRQRFSPVLRAIDLLADADRENITATLRGGTLKVKLPKGRVESLAAARSALLGASIDERQRNA